MRRSAGSVMSCSGWGEGMSGGETGGGVWVVVVGRRRWRMELMGIGSSRIKGTSRNRLYGLLGLRGFTGKESKDHSARRDDKQASTFNTSSHCAKSSYPLEAGRATRTSPSFPLQHPIWYCSTTDARPISPLFCISMTLSCRIPELFCHIRNMRVQNGERARVRPQDDAVDCEDKAFFQYFLGAAHWISHSCACR